MNIVLWVLQVLLGIYFLFVGVNHFIIPPGLPEAMSWMYELSPGLHWFSGIAEILDGIVDRIPAPQGDPDAPLKALIFDSWFDSYRGVITLVRIFDGTLKPGTKVQLN